MVFPALLPQSLREILNSLHFQGEFGDYLQQLAEKLRDGFRAAGAAVVIYRNENSTGAKAGRIETTEMEIIGAERCLQLTETVTLSHAKISGEGFFIPLGNHLLAINEPHRAFVGGIIVLKPTTNLEVFTNALLMPLLLSQLLERVLYISESFPIGTYAHDIKHYLLLSEAACERLSDTTPDAEPLRSIRAALQRMQVLTSTLLLTERDRANALRFQPIRVSVSEIVNEVVNGFQPIAERVGVELRYLSGDCIIEAEVDPTLFPSIVTNLLDNALKYCPRGGTVTTSLSNCDSGFRLTIADNGSGIPQSDIASIFTRGYRGSNSASASGHGFGLTIVKRLVELHRGAVDLNETPGGGSTFIVTVPCAKITH